MKIKTLAVLIMVVAMGMMLINFNITFGASEPEVVINEFVSNNATEWVELYNNGSTDVDLTDWTLEDEVGNSKSLSDLGTIAVGGYEVYSCSSGWLNNGGDVIWLNSTTENIDRVGYGTSGDAPAPDAGNSTGRYPNGVDTNNDTVDFTEFDTPTPGETNVISKVVISIGTVIGNKTAPIRIDNASNVGSADINITYNSSVCVITEVTNGSFDITVPNLEQNETGLVRIGAYQAGNPGLNGSIILADLTFQSNGTNGTSTLNLTVNTLTDATPECNHIPYTITNGTYLTFLNGDIDGNGEVTLFDAMYLAKHVIGISDFEKIVEAAADVNGNGEIEISDAMYLAKHVLGISGFGELK
jgi:hypothetical protein